MRSLVIVLLAAVAVSASPRSHDRIVGGSLTTINQYPDMAALLFSSGTTGHRQSCGGTILNNRSILTAAHCTIGNAPARWRVRLGSTNANSGGVLFNSLQLINHPQYNSRTFDSDISIIRVQGTIGFSNTIRAGSFAGANYNVADNQVVWATGWGRISSNGAPSEQLRHVQIWTINLATCRQRFTNVGMAITDNMLCSGVLDVGGRDQCFGDSGGPLYHNGIVVGVCSFGPPGLCADSRWPGVNARVQRFSNWIVANR